MTIEEYWYWLCTAPAMWQGKIDRLIKKYETPEKIFHFAFSEIEKEDKLSRNISMELNKLDKSGISFIYYGHKLFPKKLYDLYDNPYCLFVKGNLPDPQKPLVAMIGARDCSNYGKEMALKTAEKLARNGIQVISGLARGIDAFSQKGAIKGGGSVFGVAGCGIDICYPRENIELFMETIRAGGMISEYPPGTRPAAWRFPHRNRIISGLSDKIIIMEAKEKSGSLITVEHALEQGRDVFAVPGRLTDPLSTGCNRLIREGAQVFTEITDLYPDLETKKENFQDNKRIILEKDFEVVYSNVDLLPKSIGQISKESNFTIRKTAEILVELELAGIIYETMKTYFSRKL